MSSLSSEGSSQNSSPNTTIDEGISVLRTQKCIECGFSMGDMPGSRDAICGNCGYKDPCCE